MKPSENAENLAEQFEGCKLEAYQDQAGVWTIGYGHTKGVTMESRITGETAGLLLLEDLDVAAEAVNTLVKVPLNQNQFDALCDFVFNLGQGSFGASTMLKLINNGQFDQAGQEFSKWDKVRLNGVLTPSQGLLRRRLAEKVLFEAEV
jgi:lysozyme